MMVPTFLFTKKIITALASLQMTLTGLFFFSLGLIFILYNYPTPTIALSPGFGLLLVNLVCAIVIKEKIHHNPALLIFHLALLVFMCLLICSRLSYMKGWLQLNEGETFSQMTGILHQGPFYPEDLSQIAFRQLNYKTRITRGSLTKTQSFIALPDSKQPIIIQDQTPLIVGAYHFTLTGKIGYSLLFNWKSGFEHYNGHVILPRYNRHSLLTHQWTIPNTDLSLELLLDMDTDSAMVDNFKLPTHYQLVISHQKNIINLKTGQSHHFKQGQLTFLGLKRWIGYDVFYDWTIPWLLVAVLLAIASLGTFLWQKMNKKSWHE
jgi:hypothetical protein